MNPSKVINSVIISVVLLAVSGAMYPILADYIANITGTYSNTAILSIISVLYWILIAAGMVLYWIKSFGIHIGKGS